jgi:hypothetical protein
VIAAEEERAAEHRRQREARCAARCERLAGLSGDPDARRALSGAWRPVYLAMIEAQLPPDPAPEDECLC